MLYFAYGSNLCTARLRSRAPSARVRMSGALRGWVLRFHKRSVDGSGKCDVLETRDANDTVPGVLFDIEPGDKAVLDRAELEYDGIEVDVEVPGRLVRVFTYRAAATAIEPTLRPYTWYKALVVAGAREHDLGAAHIERLESVEAIEDLDVAREARERAFLPRTFDRCASR